MDALAMSEVEKLEQSRLLPLPPFDHRVKPLRPLVERVARHIVRITIWQPLGVFGRLDLTHEMVDPRSWGQTAEQRLQALIHVVDASPDNESAFDGLRHLCVPQQ